MTLAIVAATILGGGVTWGYLFLLGRFYQQRKQVLELRQTNVALFDENRQLKHAYAYLQEQVQKIQSGPVSAVISSAQVNQIAELLVAKLDFKTLNNKEISKKDVN